MGLGRKTSVYSRRGWTFLTSISPRQGSLTEPRRLTTILIAEPEIRLRPIQILRRALGPRPRAGSEGIRRPRRLDDGRRPSQGQEILSTSSTVRRQQMVDRSQAAEAF